MTDKNNDNKPKCKAVLNKKHCNELCSDEQIAKCIKSWVKHKDE